MDITLYPGLAFSPQAELSEGVGAADTILKVSDSSRFPPPPNLATIGTDEDGETVLYTALAEGLLSGCVRGVEGAARAWQAGEVVARNFTAKDHNDLIAAVLAAQGGATDARQAAETAQSAADAAQATADAAGAAADAAQAAADNAQITADTAQGAADNAQTAADAAKGAADNAQAAADNAQGAADNAQAAADNAKGAADNAQAAADTAQTTANSAVNAATAAQATADSKLAPDGEAGAATVAFEPSAAREPLESGGTLSALLGRVARWLADLKAVAFSGVYADLSGAVGRPGTGANAEVFNSYASNFAAGQYSHAEGRCAVAAAKYASHAEGATCIVADKSQVFKVASFDAASKKFTFDTTFGEFTSAFPLLTSGQKLVITNIYYIGDAAQFTVASVDSASNAVIVSESIPTSNFTPKYAVNISHSPSSGYCSHAEGDRTTAIGSYGAHAEGRETVATGDNGAHAEGNMTLATGNASHAEGCAWTGSPGSTATALAAHAEGISTIASGNGSHSEGSETQATGSYAHAEGQETIASGSYSHSEGYGTHAVGAGAHAEGINSIAEGHYSRTGGYGTIAAGEKQTAIGVYNARIPNGVTKVVVGKGMSDTNRANCFRVTDAGTYATGSYNATGADYAEYFQWADGNPDGVDRVGRFVALAGEQIRLAGPGDGFLLGVVSGAPSVTGDAHDDQWRGMFLEDVYGRPVYEERDFPAELGPDGEEIMPARRETVQALNPDYDHTQEYLPRSQRPEWAAVGMMGKLVVDDDGSCVPDGWCTAGEGGIAVRSDTPTRYRVMCRVDANHIRILIL